jgi:hypothetical protein
LQSKVKQVGWLIEEESKLRNLWLGGFLEVVGPIWSRGASIAARG